MAERRKKKRVTVSVLAEVWDEVLEEVEEGQLEDFVAGALRQRLVWLRQKRGLERGFGAWASEEHPDLAAHEDTQSYVQSLREADITRISSPAQTGARRQSGSSL